MFRVGNVLFPGNMFMLMVMFCKVQGHKKDAGEGGHLEHVQCCRYDYETTLNSYDQELY